MFSKLVHISFNANDLPFICCDNVKLNASHKVQCVVNKSLKLKRSIVLGKTYTTTLERLGSCLWFFTTTL